ncbi:MAG: hypothetical protein K0Q55_3459 [Verrucomicrobia bacterium]|jgi:hypothetical protein|nr:hypothetical protein [Verrucomicrobiota bacterium]
MKTLHLTRWHLVIWLSLALLAAAGAVSSCLSYNQVAGTDKTPGHIARIATAVVIGPMAGPVANPAATDLRIFTRILTMILLGIMLLSTLPFILMKKPVTKGYFILAWGSFVVTSAAWFFSALVSIGMHLF